MYLIIFSDTLILYNLSITKMKTKIKNQLSEKQKYVYILAKQIRQNLENEDIETYISVLADDEKQYLAEYLKKEKIQAKTPADYQINRRIYLIIAFIMDKSVICQNRAKNIS